MLNLNDELLTVEEVAMKIMLSLFVLSHLLMSISDSLAFDQNFAKNKGVQLVQSENVLEETLKIFGLDQDFRYYFNGKKFLIESEHIKNATISGNLSALACILGVIPSSLSTRTEKTLVKESPSVVGFFGSLFIPGSNSGAGSEDGYTPKVIGVVDTLIGNNLYPDQYSHYQYKIEKTSNYGYVEKNDKDLREEINIMKKEVETTMAKIQIELRHLPLCQKFAPEVALRFTRTNHTFFKNKLRLNVEMSPESSMQNAQAVISIPEINYKKTIYPVIGEKNVEITTERRNLTIDVITYDIHGKITTKRFVLP